jgi:polysaccharide biosynthesis transport protein
MPDNRHSFEIQAVNSQSYTLEQSNVYGIASGKNARIALLREWQRIIYRHKWLILSLVLVVLPFATIYAYRSKPIYQATATIDIRPETSSLSKTGDIVLVASDDNTKAEMVIIKSLPVIKKAVVSLNLEKNPRFLDVTTKRSVLELLRYLKGGEPESKKVLAQEGVIPQEATQKAREAAGDFMMTADNEDGESSATRGEQQTEHQRLEPFVQTLLRNLNVEGVRDTRLIKISFMHTDPNIAADVANGVAFNFIKHNFETKNERIIDTSNWLGNSTRKLKSQVEMAEQKLVNYSRENNIFSLEGKENLTADKMARLHDQVMRAETDRLLKQSLYEEVKAGRVAQLPEAFADPKTAELRKALNELAVNAAQLSVKFGAKHPKLQEIRLQMATYQEQISGNQSMLEERLKADYERAVREEGELKAALKLAKNEAVQQNQATIQYSVLKQDLETAKALYTDFLNKTSQMEIQRAEQYNNVRLIEAAETPGEPIGPNRTQTILLAFILSLVLGIGSAYLIENLNTTIRTVDDISRATQLPLLAVIPALTDVLPQGKRSSLSGKAHSVIEPKSASLKDNDRIEQLKDSTEKPVLADSMKMVSAAAEAYRMLRTSILLSTAGHPPKTILVTSGQPGDGKTTTVFNVALVLTQLKAEVLIVDCDMRRPRIDKLFKMTKSEGLSTFLTSGGSLDNFIKRAPLPYLSILPCGFVPPNPSELISSENMKDLLCSLEERFDFIILDSPPLVTVTDSIILSTLVDGTILVVKSGQSKSTLVSRVCQNLSTVGAKVLGVTLNNLDIRKEGQDYYHYYQYYSDHLSQNIRNRPANR